MEKTQAACEQSLHEGRSDLSEVTVPGAVVRVGMAELALAVALLPSCSNLDQLSCIMAALGLSLPHAFGFVLGNKLDVFLVWRFALGWSEVEKVRRVLPSSARVQAESRSSCPEVFWHDFWAVMTYVQPPKLEMCRDL